MILAADPALLLGKKYIDNEAKDLLGHDPVGLLLFASSVGLDSRERAGCGVFVSKERGFYFSSPCAPFFAFAGGVRNQGQLLMTQRERDRLGALKKTGKKLITQKQAAQQIGRGSGRQGCLPHRFFHSP